MAKPEFEIKVKADTVRFISALKDVSKAVQELGQALAVLQNQQIVIETINEVPKKKWWQFWKTKPFNNGINDMNPID